MALWQFCILTMSRMFQFPAGTQLALADDPIDASSDVEVVAEIRHRGRRRICQFGFDRSSARRRTLARPHKKKKHLAYSLNRNDDQSIEAHLLA